MATSERLALYFFVALIAAVAGAASVFAAHEGVSHEETQRICISAVGPVTIGPGDEATGDTSPVTECFTKEP